MFLNFKLLPIVFIFSILILIPSKASSQVSYENAFPNISFNVPVEIQNASDASNRLFVVEQQGIIKVFPNNNQVTSNQVDTFLDISSEVTYSAGQEIGLLGLAFHPQFSTNRYIYVYYTDRTTTHRINIVRYQVSDSNANLADINSKTIIAQFTKNQTESNHNGGKIAFGPDGYLYISVGDGGGGGDPQGNAQNLNTVFGSILRLDVDVNGDNPIENNPELPNGNYEIPSDNPRVGQTGLDEIYAWGIRNTWKMAFDAEGRLWGADVGQNAREEINLITKGGNFGWNRFEGNADYRTNSGLVTSPDIKPIYTYGHTAGDRSITGGYVYRGSLTSPSLQGKYIYGDYLTGRVWALSYNQTSGATNSELLFRASGESISSFGEDEFGELYFSGYGTNGKIFKLSGTINEPVTIPVDGVGEWKGLGSGTNGTVTALIQGTDNTYVGGSFSSADGITTANLALITTDEQWQAFDSGINGTISTIAMAPNEDLYVGGNFTQIGGINANNIAFWNGSNWTALGSGTSGPVLELQFNTDGNLFVGGIFSNAGGQTVNNIAIWQNNTWSSLTDSTTGIAGTNNEIRSLAFDTDNNLYIGGNFDTAGGVSTARIAKWNGSNWSGLGAGTSGFVQAITIVDNFLYAGGNFNLAGNRTANRIARWNLSTSSWETLGFGLSGSVNAIASDGNHIFVGGDFETASDLANNNKIVNNIARWSNANGWEALGPNRQVGTNSSVESLAFSVNLTELLVGGNFDSAGGEQFNNIAVWGEALCTEESIIPEYEVNSVLDSGSKTLTLNEGDMLRLGIVSNTTNFTILLPNGQEVLGDYNLGPLTMNLAGSYIFTTDQGCTSALEIVISASIGDDFDNDGIIDDEDTCPDTPNGETVNANGCSDSQLDDDNDGVTNDLDLCSETPVNEQVNENGCAPSQLDDDSDGVVNSMDICPGTSFGISVDSNGCELSVFPEEQFTIVTTTNSCATDANGTSQITSLVSGSYIATLIRDSEVVGSYEFTEALDIEGLESGSYQICILSSTANIERCYPFGIDTSVDDLQIVSSLNETDNTTTLSLNGASKYYINLNGTEIETELNNVTLELTEEINTLQVRSGNDCQGIYEETIVLNDAFIVYPNPITDFVIIDLRYLSDEQIEISLYSASGRLLHHDLYTTINETATIDTAHLAPGYFFLHIKGNSIDKGFKLYK